MVVVKVLSAIVNPAGESKNVMYIKVKIGNDIFSGRIEKLDG